MPPLVYLDPVEECDIDVDSIYCNVYIEYVSDEPNKLLDMMKEYSERYITHFNHTKAHYGVCASKTCKKFYQKNKEDLKVTLETCLNESLLIPHNLKAKISDYFQCNPLGPVKKIDSLDIIFGAICVIILLANIVGSLSDYFIATSEYKGVLRYLLCFSLQRNWSKLVAIKTNADSGEQLLNCLHGVRVVMMISIVTTHTIFVPTILTANPHYVEQIYEGPLYFLMQNGSLFIHVFLVMSGLLFVYNWLLYSKEHVISWFIMIKYIVSRWLRFTPAYAFTLALSASWLGHLQRRGFWNRVLEEEMNSCRNNWWHNVLYINNYFSNTKCMPQSWYLATDMQLSILGAIIYMTCKTMGARKIVISLLFVIGIVLPAAHVYFQDLDGIMLFTPETIRTFSANNLHFDIIYKRGYNNIPNYLIGMTIGYLLYHWQSKGDDFVKYKTFIYRMLFWFLVLLTLISLYCGNIFYSEDPRPQLYTRMLFAALMKPLVGSLIGGLLIGLILKFEDIFDNIFEWSIWTILSRLTFGVYLIHVLFIQTVASTMTRLIQFGPMEAIQLSLSMVAISFTAALFLWLLVESPFAKLMSLLLAPQRKKKEVENGTKL